MKLVLFIIAMGALSVAHHLDLPPQTKEPVVLIVPELIYTAASDCNDLDAIYANPDFDPMSAVVYEPVDGDQP